MTGILDSMQTGIIVVDAESHRIIEVNRYAAQLIELPKEEIEGRICHDFICPSELGKCPVSDLDQTVDNSERILLTADGYPIPVLKSVISIVRHGRRLLVESIFDITPLKRLMKEQELDISLSKAILGLTNGNLTRHIRLQPDLDLACSAIYLPSHQEGGDHYLVKPDLDRADEQRQRTLFSLKDQSGHQAGCILRSIITDHTHQYLLEDNPDAPVEEITALLNRHIAEQGFFQKQDFVTMLNGQLDHHSLALRLVPCGQSDLLVIRGNQVLEPIEANRIRNLPLNILRDAEYQATELRLRPGDSFLLFTDGLREALGVSDPARLTEAIVAAEPGLAALEIAERLLAEAADNCGCRIEIGGVNKADDDITVLGFDLWSTTECEETTIQPSSLSDLQSEINNLLAVFQADWEELGFDHPNRLEYGLSEALVNAWKHGNQKDPEKTITIRHRFGSDFYLEVTDQGPGFDPDQVIEARFGEEVFRTSGRGLILIRRLTDWVGWNESGNTIRMSFDRIPGPAFRTGAD